MIFKNLFGSLPIFSQKKNFNPSPNNFTRVFGLNFEGFAVKLIGSYQITLPLAYGTPER